MLCRIVVIVNVLCLWSCQTLTIEQLDGALDAAQTSMPDGAADAREMDSREQNSDTAPVQDAALRDAASDVEAGVIRACGTAQIDAADVGPVNDFVIARDGSVWLASVVRNGEDATGGPAYDLIIGRIDPTGTLERNWLTLSGCQRTTVSTTSIALSPDNRYLVLTTHRMESPCPRESYMHRVTIASREVQTVPHAGASNALFSNVAISAEGYVVAMDAIQLALTFTHVQRYDQVALSYPRQWFSGRVAVDPSGGVYLERQQLNAAADELVWAAPVDDISPIQSALRETWSATTWDESRRRYTLSDHGLRRAQSVASTDFEQLTPDAQQYAGTLQWGAGRLSCNDLYTLDTDHRIVRLPQDTRGARMPWQ